MGTEILQIVLIVLVFYFLVVFVFLRLIVPFMGFKKYKIPEHIPVSMTLEIKRMKSENNNAATYLNSAYEFIKERWQDGRGTGRLNTIKYFFLIFRTDLNNVWENTTFAHCNTLNYALACMLVHSQYFTEDDFRLKHVFCNGVIHQYLQARVDGKWIDADPASGNRNYPLGKHMEWFA